MSYALNEKIRDLKPYEPISGTYKIRLDANESFLPVPSEIMEKISQETAKIEYNRYPDPLAAELCQSFAEHYGIDAGNVTAGNGSDELISVISTTFLMKGEKTLVAVPDFSMYQFYASVSETNCIVCQKKDDLSIDVEQLIAQANAENVRMILFSNPCNPTSIGLTRQKVRKLISSVSALVVLDEAYMDFWNESLLTEVNEYNNLIILRTCSKAFGMAAIRLGFAVANETLTQALRAVKSPYNVNALTQKIGSVVLKEHQKSTDALKKILQAKEELYTGLKNLEKVNFQKMHVYESSTNFVLLKMLEAERVFNALLKRGIAVRFMGDYLRITAGSGEENAEVLRNLKDIL